MSLRTAVLAILLAAILGFGAGTVIPAHHHYEAFAGKYVLDTSTGQVCNPLTTAEFAQSQTKEELDSLTKADDNMTAIANDLKATGADKEKATAQATQTHSDLQSLMKTMSDAQKAAVPPCPR